jgi:cyclopropane fatty-acyl-phospholipid synthase-like methyltransferase
MVNERFSWAVSVLSPSPSENFLEIGCGAGILTEQIALQLQSGTITAIDKSKPMMKRAEQRNAEYIHSGKVRLVTTDFANSKLAAHCFDKIVAFNVNIFWQGSEKDFQQIRHCLKPTGQLYIFYETPSWANSELENKIKKMIGAHRFNVADTIYLKSPACICVIAKG